MNVSVRSRSDSTGGDGTLRPDEVFVRQNGGVFPAMTICIRCAFSCGGMSAEMTREYRFGTPPSSTQGLVVSCRRWCSVIFHEMFICHLR